MPKINGSLPSYRLHKQTGQAVVTLSGKDHYLGPHGTKFSKQRYDQAIAEWLANGRQIVPEGGLTISELILQFWKFAQKHYENHPEERTGELPPHNSKLKAWP